MKQKLFPNIRRMTNLFCLGIFCVTAAVLALRLTVFSEMAASVPETAVSNMVESEQGGYRINGRPVFPTATSKGDVFISNMEGNDFSIIVTVTLEETGQSILESGFVKPGGSYNSLKLNAIGQALEDGLYPCVAEIAAYDPDSLKPVGVSAKENITVQIGYIDEDETTSDEDETTSDEDETSSDEEEATAEEDGGDDDPTDDGSFDEEPTDE